jgi:hypothetical protein
MIILEEVSDNIFSTVMLSSVIIRSNCGRKINLRKIIYFGNAVWLGLVDELDSRLIRWVIICPALALLVHLLEKVVRVSPRTLHPNQSELGK